MAGDGLGWGSRVIHLLQERDQGLVLFSKKQTLLSLCSQLKSEVSLASQRCSGGLNVSLKKKIIPSYKERTNLFSRPPKELELWRLLVEVVAVNGLGKDTGDTIHALFASKATEPCAGNNHLPFLLRMEVANQPCSGGLQHQEQLLAPPGQPLALFGVTRVSCEEAGLSQLLLQILAVSSLLGVCEAEGKLSWRYEIFGVTIDFLL